MIYFSADLQKVVMLPRLPGNKTSVFTQRIILFHETFAPLVPEKKLSTMEKGREDNTERRNNWSSLARRHSRPQ